VSTVSEHRPETRAALEPPASLLHPLEERVRLLEDDELDLETWCEEANRWAEVADARYRACTELRPFGPAAPPIRFGVKDTVDVAGFATRLGLRRYRHYPARTAAVLEDVPPALVNAKLATTELALALEHGCVNPFFPHLDPAGSSTGCAVAVAAHVSDVALGTDTTISVRHPAAACGVVGLRVTHDPRLLEGIFPLSPLLDAPGWVTRTADDLAFVWERILGGGGASEALGQIGVVREALEEVEEPAIRSALESVCEMLVDAGRVLTPVSLGVLWHERVASYELCGRDAWDSIRRWRDRFDESLGESTSRALEIGAAVEDSRRRKLLGTIETCRRAAHERFAQDGVDVWLLPVADLMPRDLDEEEPPPSALRKPSELRDDARHVSYATIASVAGLPSIVFPVALDEATRAPVELQAIGPPRSELRLIRLAQEIAALVGDLGFSLSRYPERTRR
jgi:Asp-tRNA(Asn)/Glu-tRNA(Gln) amidotransferase A subunit family amidase